MNAIKRFEFEGKPLEFRQVSGEWWATAEEAARVLGHKRARAVLTLADRHKKEFRPGEQGVIDLSTPGGIQPVRVFSPRGLARLCLLGRTEVSRRLHDWVIYDVMEQLRAGSRVVTPEEMEAALRLVVEKVAAKYEAQIAQMGGSIASLAKVAEMQASNAGRMLSLISREPEIRRIFDEERDRRNGQARFPFGDTSMSLEKN